MQAMMTKLTYFIERRRKLVVTVWAVLLVAAVPFSLHQTDHLTQGGFVAPGSESAAVDQQIGQFRVPQFDLGVLISRPTRGAIDRAARLAARVPGVQVPPAGVVAADRHVGSSVALFPLLVRGGQDARIDAASNLLKVLHVGDGRTYVGGQDALWAGLHVLQKQELTRAESIGLPITLLILLATFGALAAAALPVVLGVVSVTLTGAATYFLSEATAMSVFVTNATSMLGIGVAVDYSLFVLARYREAIRQGHSGEEARAIAMRTSGLAVAFSGATVVACLLGLLLAPSTTMRSMALGMIVVVAISVLGALTLLPALIAVLGRPVHADGRTRALVDVVVRPLRPRPDFWGRWSRRIMRRPAVAAIAASSVMLVLAIPTLSLHLGESATAQFPPGNVSRTGTELAARIVGPGALGPVEVIVTPRRGSQGAGSAAVAHQLAVLRARPDVASVSAPTPGPGGRFAVTIVPRFGPETDSAEALVSDLRRQAAAGTRLASVGHVQVGGATALTRDFVALVRHSFWKIALFIVVISYLILLVMLRSVLLPLKAVAMTLLSVAAAHGVMVAVFQWGWLDGLFGYQAPGYIESIAPPLLLAVVFGLSMDYEVYLLSRIREARSDGADDRVAVARGLALSAGTITSAALIMVSVFAAFAAVGVPSIKEIGLGLAVAIALDASVVRLVLVPATMELMGRWNWWLPPLLERHLPRLVDGAPAKLRLWPTRRPRPAGAAEQR